VNKKYSIAMTTEYSSYLLLDTSQSYIPPASQDNTVHKYSKQKPNQEREDSRQPPPCQASPPFLLTGPGVPTHKVVGEDHHVQDQDGVVGQEEEWKNIKVMLDCICGMVEKTQSAINILQQRQIEPLNIRDTEQLVTELQNKASIAITEVKESALEEIKQAESIMKQKVSDTESNSKEECCWNCGRPARETCSGCSLARYCGPFCQHKDWEEHARLCKQGIIINMEQGEVVGDPPPRDGQATSSRKE